MFLIFKQAIHKRSQLNEDQIRKRRNTAGQHFHHQNPIALHSLIDVQLNENKFKKGQPSRNKRQNSSAANMAINKQRSISAGKILRQYFSVTKMNFFYT